MGSSKIMCRETDRRLADVIEGNFKHIVGVCRRERESVNSIIPLKINFYSGVCKCKKSINSLILVTD